MLKVIKFKMTLLYLLNVFDLMATIFLIKQGFCREANVIMIDIVSSPFKSLIIKILLPAALMIILYSLARTSGRKEIKIINLALKVGLFFYAVIAVNNILLLCAYLVEMRVI